MTNELINQVRELLKAGRSGWSTEVELGKLRYQMAKALLSQHAELTAARDEIARLRNAMPVHLLMQIDYNDQRIDEFAIEENK